MRTMRKKRKKRKKKMNNTITLILITMIDHTRLYMSLNCIIAVVFRFILSTYPRVRNRDQVNDRLCSWREGR
jgi:hypothetical protein